MHKALHIAKKNELYALIKVVGVHWQEPIEDLRSYAKFVALEWDHNLEFAIECFRDLKKQTEILKLKTKKVD